MPDLDPELHASIVALSADGDRMAEEGRYREARALYGEAWALLPAPVHTWEAGLWLLAAIADVSFLLKDFVGGRNALMQAVTHYDEARGNPFIRLRLGQCLYELGEPSEAANWLAGAYLSEGVVLFSAEDPKYLSFIKAQLQPPPGGWPEGW